jgi:hypothetical protein
VGFLAADLSFSFVFVEVDAFGFERGLGLLSGCFVLLCRLGLRPLPGDGLFAVVGGAVANVAHSPSVSVTSR